MDGTYQGILWSKHITCCNRLLSQSTFRYFGIRDGSDSKLFVAVKINSNNFSKIAFVGIKKFFSVNVIEQDGSKGLNEKLKYEKAHNIYIYGVI